MGKYSRIATIILLVFLLTGCTVFDIGGFSETSRPLLLYSPVEGVWKVKEIITSDSRFSYERGDLFYFDIDLFATSNNIQLSPDYEVINFDGVKDEGIFREFASVVDTDDVEHYNLVQINRRGYSYARVLLVSDDTIYLSINKQLLKLAKVSDTVTEEERVSLIETYSRDNDKKTDSIPWAFAIGTKNTVLDEESGLNQSIYTTYLITYIDGEYDMNRVEGLIINGQSMVDHITVSREPKVDGYIDTIYLNGEKRKILDINERRQSGIFTINYLSPDYMTLEYIKSDEPDTLSTYSMKSRVGFEQLRSEDLISFSYDKIYERYRKIDSITTLSEAGYNIGLSRENGLTVLKSRLATESDDMVINRDFTISSEFHINENKEKMFALNRRLKDQYPDMIDFYINTYRNMAIIIGEEYIVVYDIENSVNNEKMYIELNKNTKVISGSGFDVDDLDMVKEYYTQDEVYYD